MTGVLLWNITRETPNDGNHQDIFLNLAKAEEVSIVDVYDNYQSNSELETAWGFSCIVKIKNTTLLFDTGGEASILLSNMQKLGINPEVIDIIVISHIHEDHVGGLWGFLDRNADVSVYIPNSFPASYKNKIKSKGATEVNIDRPKKITCSMASTGELNGPPKEQSLLISTEKGLVVVTGCAHPGIVSIVKKAKELTEKKVYLVMGGFHLSSARKEKIQEIVNSFRNLSVQKVGPSHCSGKLTRQLFEKEYGGDFIPLGVGKRIEICDCVTNHSIPLQNKTILLDRRERKRLL